jgi:hypothetical protein
VEPRKEEFDLEIIFGLLVFFPNIYYAYLYYNLLVIFVLFYVHIFSLSTFSLLLDRLIRRGVTFSRNKLRSLA